MSIARKFRPSFWIVLVLVLVGNAFFFGGHLTAWVADETGAFVAPISGWFVRMRIIAATMFSGIDLAKENVALKEEVIRVQARLSQQDVVRQQLDTYRAAVGIRERIGTNPVEAGIFSYPQGGGIRQIIINRGTDDWVVAGMTVVTPHGALIGTVEQAFDHHAIVRILGDPAFEVTARIMGSTVSGLVRVDGVGDLILDLVQKEETVTEGSIVITSGDDLYPAGFIIGTIRSVDNTATTLFQVVRITPSVSELIAGRVIIVRP